MRAARSAVRDLPLTIRVPVMVAGLMVVVGTLASWLVLAALVRTQERHVRELATIALDGLAASISAPVSRRDVWETFDALDRLTRRGGGFSVRTAVVLLPDGTVLAASDPGRFPTLRPAPREDWLSQGSEGRAIVFDDAAARARVRYPLGPANARLATILAEIDTRSFLAQRRRVLYLLLASNSLLTLALAGGGYLLARRMLRPLGQLTEAVERMRRGRDPEIDPAACGSSPEFRSLFRRFALMARAVRERETLLRRLAEEERLAQLGRLATGTAHEINNPLAGLLTAVDTLRAHGHDPAVRTTALDILERGLLGIRNLVRAMLVAYRDNPDDRRLSRDAVEDLQHLIHHEIAKRRLLLEWRNELPLELPLPSGQLRQALLNLLLNACQVTPVGGRVAFEARAEPQAASFIVEDEGPGMPQAGRDLLLGDEPLPPEGFRGLGLWTTRRILSQLGGRVACETTASGGTRLRVQVPLARERIPS